VSIETTQKAKIKSKYTINPKILGTGGMSTVYSACLQEDSATKVAIKVINKIRINNKLSLVEKEIKIMKKLNHPYIVKYMEYFENEYN
jgi:serine/threonine protein kinase